MLEKPIKVLCKRTFILGDNYYEDEITGEKIFHDNRHLVKGTWYDVVYNENDEWSDRLKTFSIIDNQGCLDLHFIYTEEERKRWHEEHPDIKGDEYASRDYAKWFYTPEELEKKRLRKLNKS